METSNTNDYGAGAANLRERGQETLDEARQKFSDIQSQVIRFIKERPTASLIGAVAAGFIVGRLLSRR